MRSLLVILRKPPYGTVDAAEAVRHAGGAGNFDYRSTLYMIDGGVCTARKNQEAGDTGFSGLGESLELLSDEMDIYVCRQSLNDWGIGEGDLIDGIKIDDGGALKKALQNAQAVMIF